MIVTADELANHMSREFDGEQRKDAEAVLTALQGQLELYLNRPIEVATYTDVELTPDPQTGFVYLNTPVIEVTDISVNGIAWDMNRMVLIPGGMTVGPYYEAYPLTVTYKAGLDKRWYDTIRAAIMRAASREMTHNHDDTLTVKDLTTTNEGEPETPEGTKQSGFSDKELAQFSRLKRRVVL